jgi:hypothetical protein
MLDRLMIHLLGADPRESMSMLLLLATGRAKTTGRGADRAARASATRQRAGRHTRGLDHVDVEAALHRPVYVGAV